MIRKVLFAAALCAAATARADDALPAAVKAVEKKPETQAIIPVPDYTGDIWSRSTMTGDWNGIDPFIREFSTTLVGGIRLQIDF